MVAGTDSGSQETLAFFIKQKPSEFAVIPPPPEFVIAQAAPEGECVKYCVNERPAEEQRKDWRWRRVIAAQEKAYLSGDYFDIVEAVMEYGLELQAVTPEHPGDYERNFIKQHINDILMMYYRRIRSYLDYYEYITLAGVPYLNPEGEVSTILGRYFYCLLWYDISEHRSDKKWMLKNVFLPYFKKQRNIFDMVNKLLPYEHGEVLLAGKYNFDFLVNARQEISGRLSAAIYVAKLMQKANPCTDVERIALEIYFNCRDIPIKELPDKIEELLPEEIFKDWVAGVR